VIRFDIRGAVAVLTIDHGRLNILTREMHRQLYLALQRFLRDDNLKVGVLTTPPGTSFSAGDDLKTADAPFGEEPDWEEIVMSMRRSKPMIGAVRGHCVGQGLLYLLLLTELRYATPDAQFGFPEIRRGMGGAGLASRLVQHIPPAIAMHLVLTGELLGATDAANCHLVNAVISADRLMEETLAVADKIALQPLVSLQAELWPGIRQQSLGQQDAVAQASALWDLQRRVVLSDTAEPAPRPTPEDE